MYKIILEGKAKAKVSIGKISKELEVFYNPVMEYNRTCSVNLLNCLNRKNMDIALPLAASGIRGIRFFKELNKGIIKNIYFNDISKKSAESIKYNLKLNNIKSKHEVRNEDASLFLLKSKGFDYIDIDPFGTPNPFLDSSIKKIRRQGILAVTATDTAALASVTGACKRKYWAIPLRNELKHEIGLRILIRKIQLIAEQYDKALLPVFSYFKDHYYRIFLINNKGKKEVNKLIEQHGIFQNSGPMWLGNLWDKELVDKMYSNMPDKFLKTIKEESKIETIGFYDMHELCRKHKLKIPKLDKLLKYGSRTIFNEYGLKTNLKEEELVKIIKSF